MHPLWQRWIGIFWNIWNNDVGLDHSRWWLMVLLTWVQACRLQPTPRHEACNVFYSVIFYMYNVHVGSYTSKYIVELNLIDHNKFIWSYDKLSWSLINWSQGWASFWHQFAKIRQMFDKLMSYTDFVQGCLTWRHSLNMVQPVLTVGLYNATTVLQRRKSSGLADKNC